MNKLKQKFTSYLKGQGFAATVLVAILIASVVFVNIIVYTISTVVPLYIHWDEKDDFTISSSNDALFKEYIDSGKEVTVTFCSYEDVVSSHDTGKYVLETAKKFAEKYPSLIKLRFINAVTKLDSDGKSVASDLETYLNDGENIINETTNIYYPCL